jgi:hypothetical protein
MSWQATHALLARRLRARRSELVEALFVRLHEGVRDSLGGADADYLTGLRETVGVVLDYVIRGVEEGGDWPDPLPSVALEQARRAARAGVAINTVLRRYVAGHALLSDYVVAEADGMSSKQLRHILGAQSALLERIIGEICRVYDQEIERMRRSPEHRQVELVRRILAGESFDVAQLDYPLEGWHIGVIAWGRSAGEAVAQLGARLDRRVLCVSQGEEIVWAWLGGQRRPEVPDVESSFSEGGSETVSLALGEPGFGIEGLRMSHRQAQAALSVALLRPRQFTAYADVALPASVLRDPAGARQLIRLYMHGLIERAPACETLRETLRAYFKSGRHVTAAAAKLGVERRTVSYRLRAVEERVGYRLDTRLTELEVALGLYDLIECGWRPTVAGNQDGGTATVDSATLA